MNLEEGIKTIDKFVAIFNITEIVVDSKFPNFTSIKEFNYYLYIISIFKSCYKQTIDTIHSYELKIS